MNYGSDPADQIVRFTLEGTEVALKLTGLAAKNFALFVYAVLKDQKKTRGKTRLVRMLKEQRPFKFFRIPKHRMREFAKEAKAHGLLYTPIRNKRRPDEIELVVFADDSAKVSRILDNMELDVVRAQAGTAEVEMQPAETQEEVLPAQSDSLTRQAGPDGEQQEWQDAPNFTPGREQTDSDSLSADSWHSSGSSPAPADDERKPSVRKQLEEIRARLFRSKEDKKLQPQLQPENRPRKKKRTKKQVRS